MTNLTTKTTYPRTVIMMSSTRDNGEEVKFEPVPVVRSTVIRSNTDTTDNVVFMCPLDQFPKNIFHELFLADARTGRFIVEVYSGYVDFSEVYIFNDKTQRYEYNPKLLSEVKQENNLRFYGLVDIPSLKVDVDKKQVEFKAFDLSRFFKMVRITARYENKTAIEIIESIAKEQGLLKYIKIAPRVDTSIKIGDKGAKEGYIYVCKYKSFWNILKDCAKRLGEVLRVNNREIHIGRFEPFVKKHTYILAPFDNETQNYTDEDLKTINKEGPYIRNITLTKHPKLIEKNIKVSVFNYFHDTHEWTQASAEVNTEKKLKEITKNKSSNTTDEGLKLYNTRTFKYYLDDYHGNLEELAKKILSNIIYKRWRLTFDAIGNPQLNPDDRVVIKGFFGGNDFSKIKWYVSQINERYGLKNIGYKQTVQIEGVLFTEDFLETPEEMRFRGNPNPTSVKTTPISVESKEYLQRWEFGKKCAIPTDPKFPKLTPEMTLREMIIKISDYYKGQMAGKLHCANFVSKVLLHAGVEVKSNNVTGVYQTLLNNGFTSVNESKIQAGDIILNLGKSTLEGNLKNPLGVHIGIATSNKYANHVSTANQYKVATGNIVTVFGHIDQPDGDTNKDGKFVYALAPPDLTRADLCGIDDIEANEPVNKEK